jgi:hypothetical protein
MWYGNHAKGNHYGQHGTDEHPILFTIHDNPGILKTKGKIASNTPPPFLTWMFVLGYTYTSSENLCNSVCAA